MKWTFLRRFPWLDTRAKFVAGAPAQGRLLDLGSSDGQTLRHFFEMRPDLNFSASDIAGQPESYPDSCEFHRCDLTKETLPWADGSFDAITCMHLAEHLEDVDLLMKECARLLKPTGRVYIEVPHPRSITMPSPKGRAAGTFTMNFFDDITHVRFVSVGGLAQRLRGQGLEILDSGTSRNWLFAAAHLIHWWAAPSHRKFTAKIHWAGWSAFLIAQRPA